MNLKDPFGLITQDPGWRPGTYPGSTPLDGCINGVLCMDPGRLSDLAINAYMNDNSFGPKYCPVTPNSGSQIWDLVSVLPSPSKFIPPDLEPQVLPWPHD